MNALFSHRITVAEYLVERGLPADWRYGSPLGRIAAQIYRDTYRREPSRAFRWINGRFRRVMAYTPAERHILAQAWSRYPRTTPQAPPTPRRCPVYVPVSGDAMRWTPTSAPVRNHP